MLTRRKEERRHKRLRKEEQRQKRLRLEKAAPDLLKACERALAVHYPNDDLELSPMSHLCFRELTDAIALTKKGS